MHDLILVPIEPLEERYTAQWYKRMPSIFAPHFSSVRVIDGSPLTNEVKVGTFLDINSTVHYKNSQLMKIAKMFAEGSIKANTRFFFGDIEFWGLESVRLMADMNQVPVVLTGFLHAASYTEGDAFAIAQKYQQYTEVGWYLALDYVFVGSPYSKQRFVTQRLLKHGHSGSRIIPTGNPMFREDYQVFDVQKKKQVLLTNRFDMEKRPDLTLDLFRKAKAKHPDWKFIVTTGRRKLTPNQDLLAMAYEAANEGILEIREGLTKTEYHKTLAESLVMVSHSPEESFGYCAAEAANYDCQPLLTDTASHPFIVPNRRHLFNLYEDPNGPISDSCLAALECLMENPEPTAHYVDRFFDQSMQQIINTLNHDS